MSNSIFRQKNIDKINSPESLNDYVKVTNPSVWIILVGVLLIIVGALVFGTIGKVDTNVNAAAEVKNKAATVYIDEAAIDSVKVGMKVTIEGVEYTITDIADRPVKFTEVDEYVLHKGNMEYSQWVFPVSVDGAPADGVYSATITVDKVSPMSFVFN